MSSKIPLLAIIPHGGKRVPEELEGLVALSEFDLFYQADTCANEIFSFDERAAAKIDTHVSRFFVDMDRSYRDLAPGRGDGVMKKSDLYGKGVFRENTFPDHIAVANILKRYYYPFHETIEKIVTSGEVGLIVECHTMMPIAPPSAPDAGEPRPLILLENLVETEGGVAEETCTGRLIREVQAQMRKAFAGEEDTVTDKCIVSEKPGAGHIMKKYGLGGIPFFRISLSKALFLNDVYFSYDYLKVDELRLLDIGRRIMAGIEKAWEKEGG